MASEIDIEVIETRTARIYLGDDGIVRIDIVLPDARITVTDSQEYSEALARVCQGKRRPILVDMRNVRSSDRASRDFANNDQGPLIISAFALLGNSLVTMMIGNLFVKLTRPPFPTRLFQNEVEVLQWLKQYLD
jgi:hypothetical protein